MLLKLKIIVNRDYYTVILSRFPYNGIDQCKDCRFEKSMMCCTIYITLGVRLVDICDDYSYFSTGYVYRANSFICEEKSITPFKDFVNYILF